MSGGYVYLISEDGDDSMYKIGVTRGSLESRLKKLQTGNGNRLSIAQSFYTDKPFKLEKMLHNRFGINREEGEWFLMEKKDVDGFIDICEGYQRIIESLKDNPHF